MQTIPQSRPIQWTPFWCLRNQCLATAPQTRPVSGMKPISICPGLMQFFDLHDHDSPRLCCLRSEVRSLIHAIRTEDDTRCPPQLFDPFLIRNQRSATWSGFDAFFAVNFMRWMALAHSAFACQQEQCRPPVKTRERYTFRAWAESRLADSDPTDGFATLQSQLLHCFASRFSGQSV